MPPVIEALHGVGPVFRKPATALDIPARCHAELGPAGETPEGKWKNENRNQVGATMKDEGDGGQSDEAKPFRARGGHQSDHNGEGEEASRLISPERDGHEQRKGNFREFAERVKEENRLAEQKNRGQRGKSIVLPSSDVKGDKRDDGGHDHAGGADTLAMK